MGFATILRSSWTAPLNRSTWPTCRTTFCERAIRKSSRASSRVEVKGFSTRTLMPASRHSLAISKWSGVGTAMDTTSTLPNSSR